MTAVAGEAVRPRRAVVQPVPLTRIIAVELRKMFDTRSGFWLIASIAITAVLAAAGVILFARRTNSPTPPSRPRSASRW